MLKKSGWLMVIMLVIALLAAACGGQASKAPGTGETGEGTEPSKNMQPGQAINLVGDANSGAGIYRTKCQECHGADGKGGQANPGSSDGTIPALNPIDPQIKGTDAKAFALNVDLYLEHGSQPEGDHPLKTMMGYGDQKLLTPQQIADVIAYVMSLNK